MDLEKLREDLKKVNTIEGENVSLQMVIVTRRYKIQEICDFREELKNELNIKPYYIYRPI